mmetsp:Transcript_43118/g.131351  ORF Transcript_43118/g.131351 Transcript_43118/m.131351 type:complete len:175 (+) Transcript_43118:304-828(+)
MTRQINIRHRLSHSVHAQFLAIRASSADRPGDESPGAARRRHRASERTQDDGEFFDDAMILLPRGLFSSGASSSPRGAREGSAGLSSLSRCKDIAKADCAGSTIGASLVSSRLVVLRGERLLARDGSARQLSTGSARSNRTSGEDVTYILPPPSQRGKSHGGDPAPHRAGGGGG